MIVNLNTFITSTSCFILVVLFTFSLLIYKKKLAANKIFTWKNLIRGVGVAVCAMFIRIMIKYVGNIDILTCFLEDSSTIKYYLYALAYFITNYFIGLTLGEFFDALLISLVKESTTHFLGVPLGINRPKLFLVEPFDYKHTSTVKESSFLLSSREPTSPRESISSGASSTRHRSLSPFSRPATPAPYSRAASPVPPFGPNDMNPHLDPNNFNLPNTPMNPSQIQPEYFRRNAQLSTASLALDFVINNIWKATYRVFGPELPRVPDHHPIWLPPFTPWGPTFPGPPQANHPFHTWNSINSMDQCTELHLRCIIARLEFAKEGFAITGGGMYYLNDQPNFPQEHERVTINQAIDRLLADANNSLNARRISRRN